MIGDAADAADSTALAIVPTDGQLQAAEQFVQTTPNATSAEVVQFLQQYQGTERALMAHLLVQQGVTPDVVGSSVGWMDTVGNTNLVSKIWRYTAVASAVLSGYHGVRRNHGSIGWGIVWFLMGGLFPVITPTIAFAQGYGKPKHAA